MLAALYLELESPEKLSNANKRGYVLQGVYLAEYFSKTLVAKTDSAMSRSVNADSRGRDASD